MKKLSLLLLTSHFSLFTYVFSQSTAIIGTGTSYNNQYTYPAPYGNLYYGAKHQLLIHASEMTAAGMNAGNITALAFYVEIPAGIPLMDFTIKIKLSGSTNTSSNFSFSGFTTVYGPQLFTETGGWNTHTFSTPFA